MLIPVGSNVTVTARASAIKHVQCQFCQRQYVYQLRRAAQGYGSSMLFLDNQGAKQRASNAAAKALQARLEESCEPVSCPGCGCYQPNMIARLRHRKFTWLLIVAPILAFAAIIMWGIMDPPRGSKVPTVALFTIAGCCVAFWLFKRFTYNPNDRAQDRLHADACHKEGGITLEEFEALREQARAQNSPVATIAVA